MLQQAQYPNSISVRKRKELLSPSAAEPAYNDIQIYWQPAWVKIVVSSFFSKLQNYLLIAL